MALIEFTSGTLIKSAEVNKNFADLYITSKVGPRNLCRQAIDRTVVQQENEYVEAYTSETGRHNTTSSEYVAEIRNNVASTVSDQGFGTLRYFTIYPTREYESDTDHTSGSFSNISRAFDGDNATAASATPIGSPQTHFNHAIGKTFSEKYVDFVYLKAIISFSQGSSSGPSGTGEDIFQIESYNGSSWDVENAILSGSFTPDFTRSVSQIYSIGKNVQGIRVRGVTSQQSNGSKSFLIYNMVYGSPEETTIVHNIPATAFPGATTSLSVTPFIEPANWEDGADIEVKAYDSVTNSGWISVGKQGKVITFSTLTDIDKIEAKLKPKSVSPALRRPGLRAIAVVR